MVVKNKLTSWLLELFTHCDYEFRGRKRSVIVVYTEHIQAQRTWNRDRAWSALFCMSHGCLSFCRGDTKWCYLHTMPEAVGKN